MYLIYVDESGDSGSYPPSPSRYFGLSGLVVHELRWHQTLETLIDFRRGLRQRYGLKLREEVHAQRFMRAPGDVVRIAKSLRLRLLREVLEFEATIPDISIVNVLVDKQGKPGTYDVFEQAWRALIQRFHNTLSHHNFPGPRNPEDRGLIVTDRTHQMKLQDLARRLRRYNPVPSRGTPGFRHIPIDTLVEDPVHRDSLHSYFVQISDVNAYFLVQRESPCGYVRKKGGRDYFDRLNPVLCTVASTTDPQGVVRL